jgi:hypothetical protein
VHRTIVRSLLALALVVAPVAAQDVDAIFARYNAATDPENKVASIPGMKATATFEVAAAGMRASMTIHQQRPNQSLVVVTIEGLGEMRQGHDGKTTWSSDPMGGPRILTGVEAASIADGADFAMMRRERSLFAAVEGAGEAEFDGEKCLRVKLTYKSGRVTTECFSTTTGLIIETAGKQATPQGEIDTSTRSYDYRPVGGVLMPHRIVASMMGMQQVITISDVTIGAQDPAVFELPPAIKALRGNP